MLHKLFYKPFYTPNFGFGLLRSISTKIWDHGIMLIITHKLHAAKLFCVPLT